LKRNIGVPERDAYCRGAELVMSMSSKKPAGIATNPSDRLLELMHKLKASGSYRLL